MPCTGPHVCTKRHVAAHACRVATHTCAQCREQGDTWKRLQNLLSLGRSVHCSHSSSRREQKGRTQRRAAGRTSGCPCPAASPVRSGRMRGQPCTQPARSTPGTGSPRSSERRAGGGCPRICRAVTSAPRRRAPGAAAGRAGGLGVFSGARGEAPGEPAAPGTVPAPRLRCSPSGPRLPALTAMPRTRRLPERPSPVLRAQPLGRPETTGASTAETRDPQPLPGPGGAAPGAGADAAASSELLLPPASRRRL